MFWLQIAVSFAIWISAGYSVAKKGPELKARCAGWSRRTRATAGAALLLLSCAVIVAGFLLALPHGFSEGPFSAWQWLLVTALGAVFVALQSLAVATMLSLALEDVTSEPSPTSGIRNPGGSNS